MRRVATPERFADSEPRSRSPEVLDIFSRTNESPEYVFINEPMKKRARRSPCEQPSQDIFDTSPNKTPVYKRASRSIKERTQRSPSKRSHNGFPTAQVVEGVIKALPVLSLRFASIFFLRSARNVCNQNAL